MFIPDTYEVWWTVSPEEFVRRMKREYDRFWTPERDALRARSGLSRLEVMTLASIVYEETRKTDEMPRIAGVYINRLRRGIPLQADPTVKYAMRDFGLRRILYRHLKYPSPYNTYVNKGLPPSPICMPGKNAIDAVLNFEEHDYLFFCARPAFDGYHNFARTLREHNANARAYSAEPEPPEDPVAPRKPLRSFAGFFPGAPSGRGGIRRLSRGPVPYRWGPFCSVRPAARPVPPVSRPPHPERA